MGHLADIYIIKKTRSKKEAINFLNHFLPNREESADDYWIPEGATKPIHEFYNASDLMSFLELNSNYSNRIYWRNLDDKSPNKHGMVFYNKDGSMVFGISRNADMSGNYDTQNETECLNEMKIYFDTNLGYIHYENPPADNYKEFVEIVNQLEI